MENRARVCDIKKKFESLSTESKSSSRIGFPANKGINKNVAPLVQKLDQSEILGAKCGVKRSNAFRSDKPLLTGGRCDTFCPSGGSKEPIENDVKTRTFSLTDCVGVSKAPISNKKSSPGRIETQKTELGVRERVREEELGEKAKAVLRSPLPRGPPPKKPPRTFQHGITRAKTEIDLRPKTNHYYQPYEPLYTQPSFNPKHTPNKQITPLYYMSSPIPEPKSVNRGVSNDISEVKRLVKEAYEELPPETTNTVCREVVAKRKGYVRQMSTLRKCRTKETNRNNLFDCLLLIGLDSHPNIGKQPYTKYKYPPMGVKPGRIEDLCFADCAGSWPPGGGKNVAHSYSLVLTSASGTRSYAHCRRVWPEGANIPLPLAYCIVTPNNSSPFYQKVLGELENEHGSEEKKMRELVRSLYETKFPSPGESIILKCGNSIPRSADLREELGLEELFTAVSIPVFLQIYTTLLLERKVILVSSHLRRLCDCMRGVLGSLFPLCWEHTVVSALPSSLITLLAAPTPYIIGLVSLPDSTSHQALVVDLDRCEIVVKEKCGEVIPRRVYRGLRSALSLAISQGPHLLFEALVGLWVQLIGHYQQHILTSFDNNSRTFQRESFIKSAECKGVESFLEWFTETAMFQVFISERLNTNYKPGIFEERCAEHVKEMSLKRKGKSLNKTIKNLGERIMDWTGS